MPPGIQLANANDKEAKQANHIFFSLRIAMPGKHETTTELKM